MEHRYFAGIRFALIAASACGGSVATQARSPAPSIRASKHHDSSAPLSLAPAPTAEEAEVDVHVRPPIPTESSLNRGRSNWVIPNQAMVRSSRMLGFAGDQTRPQATGIPLGSISSPASFAYYDATRASVDLVRAWQQPYDPITSAWIPFTKVDSNGFPLHTVSSWQVKVLGTITGSDYGRYLITFTGPPQGASISISTGDPAYTVVQPTRGADGVWRGYVTLGPDGLSALTLTFNQSGIGPGQHIQNLHVLQPKSSNPSDGNYSPNDVITVEAKQMFSIFKYVRLGGGAHGDSGVDWSWNGRVGGPWQQAFPPWTAAAIYTLNPSIECQLQAAAVVDTDIMWIVPVLANNNYLKGLANLINGKDFNGKPISQLADGSAYSGLKASHNIYIEHSNEVGWNNLYSQGSWNAALANWDLFTMSDFFDTTHKFRDRSNKPINGDIAYDITASDLGGNDPAGHSFRAPRSPDHSYSQWNTPSSVQVFGYAPPKPKLAQRVAANPLPAGTYWFAISYASATGFSWSGGNGEGLISADPNSRNSGGTPTSGVSSITLTDSTHVIDVTLFNPNSLPFAFGQGSITLYWCPTPSATPPPLTSYVGLQGYHSGSPRWTSGTVQFTATKQTTTTGQAPKAVDQSLIAVIVATAPQFNFNDAKDGFSPSFLLLMKNWTQTSIPDWRSREPNVAPGSYRKVLSTNPQGDSAYLVFRSINPSTTNAGTNSPVALFPNTTGSTFSTTDGPQSDGNINWQFVGPATINNTLSTQILSVDSATELTVGAPITPPFMSAGGVASGFQGFPFLPMTQGGSTVGLGGFIPTNVHAFYDQRRHARRVVDIGNTLVANGIARSRMRPRLDGQVAVPLHTTAVHSQFLNYWCNGAGPITAGSRGFKLDDGVALAKISDKIHGYSAAPYTDLSNWFGALQTTTGDLVVTAGNLKRDAGLSAIGSFRLGAPQVGGSLPPNTKLYYKVVPRDQVAVYGKAVSSEQFGTTTGTNLKLPLSWGTVYPAWQSGRAYNIGDLAVNAAGYVYRVYAVTLDRLSGVRSPFTSNPTVETVTDNHVTWQFDHQEVYRLYRGTAPGQETFLTEVTGLSYTDDGSITLAQQAVWVRWGGAGLPDNVTAYQRVVARGKAQERPPTDGFTNYPDGADWHGYHGTLGAVVSRDATGLVTVKSQIPVAFSANPTPMGAGEVIACAVGGPGFPAGKKTVTSRPDSTTFTYQEAGPVGTAVTAMQFCSVGVISFTDVWYDYSGANRNGGVPDSNYPSGDELNPWTQGNPWQPGVTNPAATPSHALAILDHWTIAYEQHSPTTTAASNADVHFIFNVSAIIQMGWNGSINSPVGIGNDPGYLAINAADGTVSGAYEEAFYPWAIGTPLHSAVSKYGMLYSDDYRAIFEGYCYNLYQNTQSEGGISAMGAIVCAPPNWQGGSGAELMKNSNGLKNGFVFTPKWQAMNQIFTARTPEIKGGLTVATMAEFDGRRVNGQAPVLGTPFRHSAIQSGNYPALYDYILVADQEGKYNLVLTLSNVAAGGSVTVTANGGQLIGTGAVVVNNPINSDDTGATPVSIPKDVSIGKIALKKGINGIRLTFNNSNLFVHSVVAYLAGPPPGRMPYIYGSHFTAGASAVNDAGYSGTTFNGFGTTISRAARDQFVTSDGRADFYLSPGATVKVTSNHTVLIPQSAIQVTYAPGGKGTRRCRILIKGAQLGVQPNGTQTDLTCVVTDPTDTLGIRTKSFSILVTVNE